MRLGSSHDQGACKEDSELSEMSAEWKNQWAGRTYLSDDLNACRGCSIFQAQTMRVAVALHTSRQHSQSGCLHAEVRAVQGSQQSKKPVGSEDAPVRLLEYRER